MSRPSTRKTPTTPKTKNENTTISEGMFKELLGKQEQILLENKEILKKLDIIEKTNISNQQAIESLVNNISILRSDLDGVIESQSLINTEFENQKKNLVSLKSEVNSLRQKNTELKIDNKNLNTSLAEVNKNLRKSKSELNQFT